MCASECTHICQWGKSSIGILPRPHSKHHQLHTFSWNTPEGWGYKLNTHSHGSMSCHATKTKVVASVPPALPDKKFIYEQQLYNHLTGFKKLLLLRQVAKDEKLLTLEITQRQCYQLQQSYTKNRDDMAEQWKRTGTRFSDIKFPFCHFPVRFTVWAPLSVSLFGPWWPIHITLHSMGPPIEYSSLWVKRVQVP